MAELPEPAPARVASAPVLAEPAVRVAPLPELSTFGPAMVARLREIRASSSRRRDDVFMKAGDSSTVSRGFLMCLSEPDEVRLSGRDELQPTLAFFRGGRAGGRDPFRRQSRAAAEGWSARQLLRGHPPPLLTEVRAIRPRFAFVMNGGNDVEGRDDYEYATRMLRIVEMLEENGVIPILNSLPPRGDSAEADRWVGRYNQISWAVATTHQLPYLDYNQVMERLPRRGLAGDGVHPNIYGQGGQPHACYFDEAGLSFGHNARNLLALRALDTLRRLAVLEEAPEADDPLPREGRGTARDPFRVRTLPFADLRNTETEGSQDIDRYDGCSAPQDEGGRELVYRLVVDEPITVRMLAVSRDDTDVDVHLLRSSPTGEACVERADREIVRELSPGVWLLSVDTFVSEGAPHPGEVMVLIAPAGGPVEAEPGPG